ncbi:MAG: hypothetical protein J3K34DRAFT_461429 [Monoraphidium minutum]|nr:MAG: hypothetical protein J3K34DRAFT_461429 [Monoraphidium minutum]
MDWACRITRALQRYSGGPGAGLVRSRAWGQQLAATMQQQGAFAARAGGTCEVHAGHAAPASPAAAPLAPLGPDGGAASSPSAWAVPQPQQGGGTTAAALLAALPPPGAAAAAATPASLPKLLRMLRQADSLAVALAAARPEVANVMKLARRIQQNARYVEAQIAARAPPSADAPAAAAPSGPPAPAAAAGGGGGGAAAAPAAAGGAGAPGPLSADKVQGIVNNIRGLVSELQALCEAPGAVAVVKKFRGPPAGGGGGGGGGGVEVDVVAHGGQTWIEVKGCQVFGLGSARWAGPQGLKAQVEAMLAAAAAPGNAARFRPPQVVVYCPFGADPEVVAELEAMGASAAVGIGSLAGLPEPHPPPAVTNLDTTTMCGLVSEVSHRPPADPQLVQWAARTRHWRDCLAAEAAGSLLVELAPHLAPGRRVVAAAAAVAQFEKLLADFGGPREAARWRGEVLPRIEVFHAAEGVAGEGEAAAHPAEAPAPPREFAVPPPVAALSLTRHQAHVFGLGLALEALTLTANSNAVRFAGDSCVALEAVVHRPVWLTGL